MFNNNIIFFSIFFIPIIPKEEIKTKLYRFKDLDINSSKKPENTHLFIEASDGDLYMVDSADNTLIIKSTDKGDNWSTIIDEDYDIIALWYDRTNEYLYYLYTFDAGAGVLYDTYIRYIDLSDDSENAVDDYRLASKNGKSMDVVKDSAGDVYGFSLYTTDIDVPGTWDVGILEWDVDAALGYYIEPEQGLGADPWASIDITPITVISDFAWFLYQTSTSHVEIWKSQLGAAAWTKMEDLGANLNLPDSVNQKGITYDGSDIIQFVVKDTGDSKNYLWSYSIGTDTATKHAEFNVALMLDRNNEGVVPNELEKGFGITDKIVYEIKPRRGGLIRLQDISPQQNYNIIAITDNFLILDNDPNFLMFESTNIESDVSEIYQDNGIVGIPNNVSMVIHPDFESYWTEGDSFKVYDPNDILAFWGIITNKSRDSRGIYIIQAKSFTNEIYKTIYEKTYSADDSDTKQKDIIDNGCNFCYRSSSIVGTTTTYDYVYNRAIAYLFYLNRFLERQVPYIEPDGKFWTKAHDGLSKNALIYPGTFNFKDDTDGDDPIGWTIAEGANTEVSVIASLDGHRKVLELNDTDVATNCSATSPTWTAVADDNLEWWYRGDSDDIFRGLSMMIYEGATRIIFLLINADDLQYYDGAYKDIVAAGISADTWYHIRVDPDDSANTFDIYLDGVLVGNNLAYENNSTTGSTYLRFLTRANGINEPFNSYIDAIGRESDPAYNVDDNFSAWNLANSWQEMSLVDIPYIREVLPGYYRGNLEITRATVRYKNNTLSIKPDDYLTLEQTAGINPLEEYRDQRIEASTEADQLADNLHDIFNLETEIIGIHIEGQGYLQPGKTADFRNTGQITIVQQDLLVIQYRYDLKNDIYLYLVLSDNIIFPNEWTTYNNTIQMQNSQTTIQSFENQEDINLHLTKEGGLACRLTNKTGVASVKGTIVEAHAATDNAFRVCDASSVESFGVVYEDGVADGSECLVVIGGRCQVLLKDATLSTRNNWVMVSDVAGRADATGASPAAAPAHFKEVGHCIESKAADTDVLAYIMLHFL